MPTANTVSNRASQRERFVQRLRAEGLRRYHHAHPFHRRMHAGSLGPDEIRRWVANQYFYQSRLPVKDALILAKSYDPAFRRAWIRRIEDQDGRGEGDGGLALWWRLGDAVGIARSDLVGGRLVLPAVRAACDDYVTLVRDASLVEAVASSLTEFFAPELLRERVVAWERHYAWVAPEALEYFRVHVPRARRDSAEALAFVLAEARTAALEDRCVAALVAKTEILWQMLDAIQAGGAPRA